MGIYYDPYFTEGEIEAQRGKSKLLETEAENQEFWILFQALLAVTPVGKSLILTDTSSFSLSVKHK